MSSEKRKEVNKIDKQEIPDSTTKERNFFEDEFVYVVINEKFVLGKITEVDAPAEKCLVSFEYEGNAFWSSFKDLKPATIDFDNSPTACLVCKSTKSKNSNIIVACGTCSRGYHQKCHEPIIESVDDDWCKKCREKRNCQLSANTVIQKTVSSTSKDASLPLSSEDLPYYLDDLEGDCNTINTTQQHCYCGSSGDWYDKMIQCCSCRHWFHENCVQCLIYPLYLGDRYYIFVCKVCNQGVELVRRLEIGWSDLLQLIMYNLSHDRTEKLFDLDRDILTYMDEHWNTLQVPPKIFNVISKDRRVKVLQVLRNDKFNSNSRFKYYPKLNKKRRQRILCSLVKCEPPKPPTFKLPNTRPITHSILDNMSKENPSLKICAPPTSDAIVTLKKKLTVANGYKWSEERTNKRNNAKPIQLSKRPLPTGHSMCIKRASNCFIETSTTEKRNQKLPEPRRNTQKMKKLCSPVENKTTNCGSEIQLPELPPTPPSEPSIVNGEPPTSPTEDVSCVVDFDDISTPNNVVCNVSLDDIFSENREPQSDISLPLSLNNVIVTQLIRPKKRKLSEADIFVNSKGKVKCKRRRLRTRSSLNYFKAIDVSGASASKLYGGSPTVTRTPVKRIPNGLTADLKSLVHKYFSEENKRVAEQQVDRFASGEEYRIIGKRKTLDGRIQYLVEWVKCTDPI